MGELTQDGFAWVNGKWYYIRKSTPETLTLYDEENDKEFQVDSDGVIVHYEYG